MSLKARGVASSWGGDVGRRMVGRAEMVRGVN